MSHNQLKQQIRQMLTDASPTQVKRMERAQTLEPLLNSLMADYAQSEDSARQAALNQHATKPDQKLLNSQLLMIPHEALQQVQERINATTGFSPAS